jgi:hypothetical protein
VRVFGSLSAMWHVQNNFVFSKSKAPFFRIWIESVCSPSYLLDHCILTLGSNLLLIQGVLETSRTFIVTLICPHKYVNLTYGKIHHTYMARIVVKPIIHFRAPEIQILGFGTPGQTVGYELRIYRVIGLSSSAENFLQLSWCRVFHLMSSLYFFQLIFSNSFAETRCVKHFTLTEEKLLHYPCYLAYTLYSFSIFFYSCD